MPQHIPVPTLEEFKLMQSSPTLTVSNEVTGRKCPIFILFVVNDLSIFQDMHTFHKNEDVVVISETDEEWHAHLLDIRMETGSKKGGVENIPWLQVQWYHNRTHVENQQFAQYVGEHELILSQDKDFVEAACLERTENILKFDERFPLGQTIGPTDMYMRWKMDIKETKAVRVGRSTKKVLVYDILGSTNACQLCYKLYQPDTDIQRYCRTCYTWCHIQCLEQSLPSHRSDILLKVKEKTSLPDVNLDTDFQSILRMPIQRGGNDGIVGNGKDIMMVWKVFEAMKILGVDKLPNSWRETISAATFKQLEIDAQYEYHYCTTCNEWM